MKRKVYITMYKILCKDGRAKRAEFQTVHGTVQTPLFMNVGTAAAIKGSCGNNGSQGHRMSDRAVKYISSPCETWG